MARFSRNQHPISQRQMYIQRYNSARYNLLLAAGFTAINLILLIAKTFTYFLFSISIPYDIVSIAMEFCGMYPAEYYEEYYNAAYDTMEFFPKGAFYVILAVALVIIGVYVLCYLFSKKKVGWLIAALALFAVDTVFMFLLYGFDISMLLDILFHAWLLIILTMGVVSYYKLKKMPPEENPQVAEGAQGEADAEGTASASAPISDSLPLRDADTEARNKIFLQSQLFTHEIVYRRVGDTNELVIDGKVYDEYTATVEGVHVLTANLDGHTFSAGLDGTHSFISADGEVMERKLRII